MFSCPVCNSSQSRVELVEEAFKIDGRHILVDHVPSEICQHCGERSFSRETTEKVRRMVHSGAKPLKSMPIPVYEFM